MHLGLYKNECLLLEDFSDYNRFPKFQPIDDRLHVNERFSIIIDHRNNTSDSVIMFSKQCDHVTMLSINLNILQAYKIVIPF